MHKNFTSIIFKKEHGPKKRRKTKGSSVLQFNVQQFSLYVTHHAAQSVHICGNSNIQTANFELREFLMC